MRWYIVVLLSIVSSSLYAMDDGDKIQERIKLVGAVHVQNEQVLAIKAKKDLGQAIYEQHCVVCHRDGLAGAPKFQNENDWKSRLTAKTKDDLLASVIKGINAMPAKGTCMECSEDELEAAIQYLLPKS